LSFPYRDGSRLPLKPHVIWKGCTEVNSGRKTISDLYVVPLTTQTSLSPELAKGSIVPIEGRTSRTYAKSPSELAKVTSLDNNPQSSTWSKKLKRAYCCALSGLNRCIALKRDAYFLTLTSAPGKGSQLAHSWDLLVKRVRRELNYKFEFMKVETSEGNGVIHAIFHSAFAGWQYDAILAYFSCLWQELHGSFIVWCSPVVVPKRVASYVVQYLSSQHGFLRRSCSRFWIFPHWRSIMLGLIRTLGFSLGLSKFRSYLSFYHPSSTSFQYSLSIFPS